MESRNNEILRFEQSILIEKLLTAKTILNLKDWIEPQGHDWTARTEGRKYRKEFFLYLHSVFPSLRFSPVFAVLKLFHSFLASLRFNPVFAVQQNKICILNFPRFTLHHQINFSSEGFHSHLVTWFIKKKGENRLNELLATYQTVKARC